MSVAFLTTDFYSRTPLIPGGCAYYRCYLPARVINQPSTLGIPTFNPIHGWGAKETSETAIVGFKHVMLKLIMNRETPKQIELAQKNAGQVIVVDIDDFYQGLTEANAAYEITSPEVNKRTNRDHYERVIAAADILTVSTRYLHNYYSARHPNVVLIRNGVNTKQFDRRVHGSHKPLIGWTGSTRYRNSDLEQLREWLPGFLEKHNLNFLHIGHEPTGPSFSDVTGVARRRVTSLPILPVTHYAQAFKFDIGIVPLSDIPFNHAKSNIKGLEYAAAGIPFVASDLPEYRLLSEDGIGKVASSPEGWVASMEALLDYRTRKAAAAACYDGAKRWSIAARADEWNAVFT